MCHSGKKPSFVPRIPQITARTESKFSNDYSRCGNITCHFYLEMLRRELYFLPGQKKQGSVQKAQIILKPNFPAGYFERKARRQVIDLKIIGHLNQNHAKKP